MREAVCRASYKVVKTDHATGFIEQGVVRVRDRVDKMARQETRRPRDDESFASKPNQPGCRSFAYRLNVLGDDP